MVQSIDENGFEAEMHRLSMEIRQLKIQYDMFFAGSLDREPFVLRGRIQTSFKRHCDSPPAPTQTVSC